MPEKQVWVVGPGQLDHEMGLLQVRIMTDIFPQGKNYCVNVLSTAKRTQCKVRITAVKTTPWTWTYELVK